MERSGNGWHHVCCSHCGRLGCAVYPPTTYAYASERPPLNTFGNLDVDRLLEYYDKAFNEDPTEGEHPVTRATLVELADFAWAVQTFSDRLTVPVPNGVKKMIESFFVFKPADDPETPNRPDNTNPQKYSEERIRALLNRFPMAAASAFGTEIDNKIEALSPTASSNEQDAKEIKRLEIIKKEITSNPQLLLNPEELVNRINAATQEAEQTGEESPEDAQAKQAAKTALTEALKAAQAHKQTSAFANASAEQVEALNAAISQAETVLANPDATTENYTEATQALNAAKDAIATSTNKEALTQALENTEAAASPVPSDSESVKAARTALADARKAAQTVADLPNASQADVDAQVEKLNAAASALNNAIAAQEQADKKAAQEAVEKAQAEAEAARKAAEEAAAKAKAEAEAAAKAKAEAEAAAKAKAEAEAEAQARSEAEVASKAKADAETQTQGDTEAYDAGSSDIKSAKDSEQLDHKTQTLPKTGDAALAGGFAAFIASALTALGLRRKK